MQHIRQLWKRRWKFDRPRRVLFHIFHLNVLKSRLPYETLPHGKRLFENAKQRMGNGTDGVSC